MSYFLKKYGKTIVAALAALVVALQAAITDGTVTSNEWVKVAVAAGGALGVFYAPAITKANAEAGRHEAPSPPE